MNVSVCPFCGQPVEFDDIAPHLRGHGVRIFGYTDYKRLPDEVRHALVTIRIFEEEGAYNPSLLRDDVRALFRQLGGALQVEEAGA